MKKLMFYDIETTGVQFWKHGIHQISFEIVINDEIVCSNDIHCQPNPKALIDPEAIAISAERGKPLTQIQAGITMNEAYKELCSTLSEYVNKYDKTDKLHLVGYNNRQFDDQFFRAFFVQNNDQYFGSWFWADSIDVMVLASAKLASVRSHLENFKLPTVAKYLGIPVDDSKLHDSYYDLYLTREIYNKIEVI